MMLIVVGSLSVCLSACLSVRRSCCEPRAVAFAVSKGGSRLVCVGVCVCVCVCACVSTVEQNGNKQKVQQCKSR